jgi:hypothetical protein
VRRRSPRFGDSGEVGNIYAELSTFQSVVLLCELVVLCGRMRAPLKLRGETSIYSCPMESSSAWMHSGES